MDSTMNHEPLNNNSPPTHAHLPIQLSAAVLQRNAVQYFGSSVIDFSETRRPLFIDDRWVVCASEGYGQFDERASFVLSLPEHVDGILVEGRLPREALQQGMFKITIQLGLLTVGHIILRTSGEFSRIVNIDVEVIDRPLDGLAFFTISQSPVIARETYVTPVAHMRTATVGAELSRIGFVYDTTDTLPERVDLDSDSTTTSSLPFYCLVCGASQMPAKSNRDINEDSCPQCASSMGDRVAAFAVTSYLKQGNSYPNAMTKTGRGGDEDNIVFWNGSAIGNIVSDNANHEPHELSDLGATSVDILIADASEERLLDDNIMRSIYLALKTNGLLLCIRNAPTDASVDNESRTLSSKTSLPNNLDTLKASLYQCGFQLLLRRITLPAFGLKNCEVIFCVKGSPPGDTWPQHCEEKARRIELINKYTDKLPDRQTLDATLSECRSLLRKVTMSKTLTVEQQTEVLCKVITEIQRCELAHGTLFVADQKSKFDDLPKETYSTKLMESGDFAFSKQKLNKAAILFQEAMRLHPKSNEVSEKLSLLWGVMAREWDERAKENARYYIHSKQYNQTDEYFSDSGKTSVDSCISEDMEILTQGNRADTLRFIEIGCGIGRMSEHFADIFGETHGIDVSSEMIREAKQRLSHRRNLYFYQGNGRDLSCFENDFADIVFSFIVFQHIPFKEVIINYIREAHRVLKPNGVFKFQVQGCLSEQWVNADKNTWHGTTITEQEIRLLSKHLGFHLLKHQGQGTQYAWYILQKSPSFETGS